MKIRNVRLEPGFRSGSVQVACGVCGVRRRKTGRVYARWELDSRKHAIGAICGECFEEELFKRFETHVPVGAVRKTKKGVCSCGRDAVGGIRIVLQHSALDEETVYMCVECIDSLMRVGER